MKKLARHVTPTAQDERNTPREQQQRKTPSLQPEVTPPNPRWSILSPGAASEPGLNTISFV